MTTLAEASATSHVAEEIECAAKTPNCTFLPNRHDRCDGSPSRAQNSPDVETTQCDYKSDIPDVKDHSSDIPGIKLSNCHGKGVVFAHLEFQEDAPQIGIANEGEDSSNEEDSGSERGLITGADHRPQENGTQSSTSYYSASGDGSSVWSEDDSKEANEQESPHYGRLDSAAENDLSSPGEATTATSIHGENTLLVDSQYTVDSLTPGNQFPSSEPLPLVQETLPCVEDENSPENYVRDICCEPLNDSTSYTLVEDTSVSTSCTDTSTSGGVDLPHREEILKHEEPRAHNEECVMNNEEEERSDEVDDGNAGREVGGDREVKSEDEVEANMGTESEALGGRDEFEGAVTVDDGVKSGEEVVGEMTEEGGGEAGDTGEVEGGGDVGDTGELEGGAEVESRGEAVDKGEVEGGGDVGDTGEVEGGGDVGGAGEVEGGEEVGDAGEVEGGGEVGDAGEVEGGGDVRDTGEVEGGGEEGRGKVEEMCEVDNGIEDGIKHEGYGNREHNEEGQRSSEKMVDVRAVEQNVEPMRVNDSLQEISPQEAVTDAGSNSPPVLLIHTTSMDGSKTVVLEPEPSPSDSNTIQPHQCTPIMAQPNQSQPGVAKVSPSVLEMDQHRQSDPNTTQPNSSDPNSNPNGLQMAQTNQSEPDTIQPSPSEPDASQPSPGESEDVQEPRLRSSTLQVEEIDNPLLESNLDSSNLDSGVRRSPSGNLAVLQPLSPDPDLNEQYKHLRRTLSHSRRRYSTRRRRPQRRDDSEPGQRSGRDARPNQPTMRNMLHGGEEGSVETLVDVHGRTYFMDHRTHTMTFELGRTRPTDISRGMEMLERRYLSLQRSFRSQRPSRFAPNLSPIPSSPSTPNDLSLSLTRAEAESLSQENSGTSHSQSGASQTVSQSKRKSSRWKFWQRSYKTVSQSRSGSSGDDDILPVSPGWEGSPPPSVTQSGEVVERESGEGARERSERIRRRRRRRSRDDVTSSGSHSSDTTLTGSVVGIGMEAEEGESVLDDVHVHRVATTSSEEVVSGASGEAGEVGRGDTGEELRSQAGEVVRGEAGDVARGEEGEVVSGEAGEERSEVGEVVRGEAGEVVRGGEGEVVRGEAGEEMRSEVVRGEAGDVVRGGEGEVVRGEAGEEVRGEAGDVVRGGEGEGEGRGDAGDEVFTESPTSRHCSIMRASDLASTTDRSAAVRARHRVRATTVRSRRRAGRQSGNQVTRRDTDDETNADLARVQVTSPTPEETAEDERKLAEPATPTATAPLSEALLSSPALKFITRRDLYTFLSNAGEAGDIFLANRGLMELVQRIRTNNNLFAKYQHSRQLVVAVNKFADSIADLPQNWEKKLNREGKVFYIDHDHCVTSFIDPRLPLPDHEFTYTTSQPAPSSQRAQHSQLQFGEEAPLRSHHTTILSSTASPPPPSSSPLPPSVSVMRPTEDVEMTYERQVVSFFRHPEVYQRIAQRYHRGVRPQLREILEDVRANGTPALERIQTSGSVAAYELALVLSLFEEDISAINTMIEAATPQPQPQREERSTGGPLTVSTLQRKKEAFSTKLQNFKVMMARLGFAQSSRLKFNIRRDHLLEDCYEHMMKSDVRHLQRKRLNICFRGEDGLDYGGPSREFFFLLSREIFNPYYGLFEYSANDTYTVQISPTSMFIQNNLDWFRFAGRVIGLVIVQGFLLDVFFTRTIYKALANRPPSLKDLESLEPAFHSSLVWILENDPEPLDLTFTVEEEAFGQLSTHELKEGGMDIPVTDENKEEYISLMLQWRLDRGITAQMNMLRKGFSEVMPVSLLQAFDASELEFLTAGTLEIDVEDWKKHTEYRNGYHATHPVVLQFWQAVEMFDNEQRLRLLQFVTGTSSVPFEGFKALRGSNGPKRFTIDFFSDVNSLPRTHTCFNRIDLPPYPSYDILYHKLLIAIEEGNTFGIE